MMRDRGVLDLIAVGWLAFGQSACTTLLPLEGVDAEASLAAIEAGDRLRVLDSNGVTTDLVVEAVGADFIEGTAAGDGQPVRIAAAELKEIRKSAPGKTIALGAGFGFLLFMQSLVAAGSEMTWAW